MIQGTHVHALDVVFLKRFSLLLAFLAVVGIGLILAAHHLNATMAHPADPTITRNTDNRIAPIGEVYAGATGAAQQAAAAQAAHAAAAANVPFGGRTDGAEIFNNGPCTACHTGGVGGAPKLDATGIGARVASQGIDELVKKAIAGFTGSTGTMPPRGGVAGLTDDQIKATVEYMVAQSKK